MNKRSSALPPEKGPNPQGMQEGDLAKIGKGFKVGALSNLGCPHRENGVQGSDIKGVKPIQVKGKKFIGVK
tara:strand:- start:204 stop:416 length:213 start_codon:yes stop_codon:yes gene_type:complete